MDHLEKAEKNSKTSIDQHLHVLGQIENGSSAHLTQRIIFLKRKKLELAKKLHSLDLEIQDMNSDESRKGTEEETLREMEKLKELHHVALGHRLTGVSVYSVDRGKAVVCFDNSYKNQFYKSDYVELIQRGDGSLTLGSYTVPCFIPMTQLAEKYLKDDLQLFVSSISDHLFAYITRKEELKMATEMFEESEDWLKVEATEPADYVKIIIGKPDSAVLLKIELLYESLLQVLPSKVNFKLQIKAEMSPDFGVDEESLSKWKEHLKILSLTKVLPDIIHTLLTNGLVNRTYRYSTDDDSLSD